MANKTGKGGFQDRPQDRGTGNVPKGVREDANKFKAMVLKYANNEKAFQIWQKGHPDELYKLAATLCPKDIDLTPTGKFILICDDNTEIDRQPAG